MRYLPQFFDLAHACAGMAFMHGTKPKNLNKQQNKDGDGAHRIPLPIEHVLNVTGTQQSAKREPSVLRVCACLLQHAVPVLLFLKSKNCLLTHGYAYDAQLFFWAGVRQYQCNVDNEKEVDGLAQFLFGPVYDGYFHFNKELITLFDSVASELVWLLYKACQAIGSKSIHFPSFDDCFQRGITVTPLPSNKADRATIVTASDSDCTTSTTSTSTNPYLPV
jgi:hypothetical protein